MVDPMEIARDALAQIAAAPGDATAHRQKLAADALALIESAVGSDLPLLKPPALRGDAAIRAKHRAFHRAMQPHRFADLGYQRDLKSIVRGVHQGVMKGLLKALAPEVRHDAPPSPPRDAQTTDADVVKAKLLLNAAARARIQSHLAAKVGVAFDIMAAGVDKKNRQAMNLIGIDVTDAAAGVEGEMVARRAENVRLVQGAVDDWYDDLRDTLDDTVGLRHEEVAKVIQDRNDVSESRAQLIARDQVGKWNAGLNQARQQAAGVTHATWSTSKDERVRPEHVALEGEVFAWDDGIDADQASDSGEDEGTVPGEAVNCRCISVPLLDEPDDEGDDASAPDDEQDDD
jgi:SPP1 gp7 family putative phage head morphogenesis protein